MNMYVQVKQLGRRIDTRMNDLSNQNMATLNEMRHTAKIFNDVLLTHHGLVQLFREQVGLCLLKCVFHLIKFLLMNKRWGPQLQNRLR